MSSLHAFLIGLMQGLTEFLPISSSAHLKLAKLLLGVDHEGESQVVFDLVCHLGTLIAVLFFLRRDIFEILRGDRKKLGLLFLGTVPLIPFYFLLKPLREYASQTHLVGFFLLCTACLLFLGDRLRLKREGSGKLRDVLCIGAMQSIALIPGISRSASTISTARILGWEAKEAVRFSFLLSIPTILGGNCLEMLKLATKTHEPLSISISSCILGFLAALGFGLLSIRYAVRFLEKGNLRPFAWYCLALGVLTIGAFYG